VAGQDLGQLRSKLAHAEASASFLSVCDFCHDYFPDSFRHQSHLGTPRAVLALKCQIHFRFGLAPHPWDPQKKALEGHLARWGLQKEISLAVLAEKKVARHHCLGLQIMMGVAAQIAVGEVLARTDFHIKMTSREETLVSCRCMGEWFGPAVPRCHIDADFY
jgi:hypothetical protein